MYHCYLFFLACTIIGQYGVREAAAQQAPHRTTPEAAFITENDAAMTTMMKGMMIKPMGDVDRDFAAMMIAHHQGAIDMARAELNHGTNEQLRQIAQKIIVDQVQEINAMHLAVGDPSSPAAPAAP